MGIFADKKKELKEQLLAKAAEADAAKPKKTTSKKDFNTLATALLNDPEYTEEIVKTEGGQQVKENINPVKELRSAIITAVAKKAGSDSAEIETLKKDVQFGSLPMYDFVSTLMEGYLDAGKKFSFNQHDDLDSSIFMETIPAHEEEHRDPKDTTKAKFKVQYDEHRKIKASSSCPKEKSHRI